MITLLCGFAKRLIIKVSNNKNNNNNNINSKNNYNNDNLYDTQTQPCRS